MMIGSTNNMEELPQTPGIVTPQVVSSQPSDTSIVVPINKSGYFARLFQGRLNRQNYSVGSLLLIVVPVIVYFIFVWELIASPSAQSLLANNPYDVSVLQQTGYSGNNQEAALMQLLQSPLNMGLALVTSLYTIFTLPIFFSLQVRRLHDLNKSGWLLIVGLIPLVNYLFPLYLTFFKGSSGENTYGPVPTKRLHLKKDILLL